MKGFLMKTFHKHLLAGVIVLGLGGSALAADANMCGPMDPMMQGPRQGQNMNRMDPAKHAEFMKARMEKRHAILHDKLKLNAEQETAWKTYIAGAQPPKAGMHGRFEDMQKLAAPDRMEKMLEFMKERQAEMTVRLVELKKFYAVLTPEQQKVFDAEMMGPRHGKRHGHQGRGPGAGPRGPMGPGASAPAPAPAAQ